MRSLKVKCSTWDHVETFYRRKLRRGNILSIRVPFCPSEGAQVTLSLELPNATTLAIDGTVIGVKPSPDGKRATIHLSLYGLTREVRARLEAMVAASRGEPVEPARAGHGAAPVVPPPPDPADAPIDEPVEVPQVPSPDTLSEYERGVFDALGDDLARMRESAAHEVLGVSPDAGIADVRAAYFALARRHHPDTYARYRAPAVQRVAEELFIHINAAYDRMRNALAASGAAIAGPALLPQDGWLVALEDIDAAVRDGVPVEDLADALTGAGVLGGAATGRYTAPTGATMTVERAARAAMAEGAVDTARERLAEALHVDPRNRRLRALYHVCTGRAASRDGRHLAAAAHFETALAHDPRCAEARADLDALRREHGARARGLYRRFLQ